MRLDRNTIYFCEKWYKTTKPPYIIQRNEETIAQLCKDCYEQIRKENPEWFK
jgi:hypothetical protein